MTTFTKLTITALSPLALCLCTQSVHAAGMNAEFAGQFTNATCKLIITEVSGERPSVNGIKTVNLGSVLSSSVNVDEAGTAFGISKELIFSLSDSHSDALCNLQPTFSLFSIILSLRTDQITTVNTPSGSKTFLKNSISNASGGTDAVVAVSNDLGQMDLQPDGQTVIHTSVASWHNLANPIRNFKLNFARSTKGVPSAGQYAATIPLTVIYR